MAIHMTWRAVSPSMGIKKSDICAATTTHSACEASQQGTLEDAIIVGTLMLGLDMMHMVTKPSTAPDAPSPGTVGEGAEGTSDMLAVE